MAERTMATGWRGACRHGGVALVAGTALALAACTNADNVTREGPSFIGGLFGGPEASGSAVSASGAPAALDAQMRDGTNSALIEGLLNRRSIVASGPMRDVADAVMAANARAAEADLRAAVLRADARALNWLPTIGPNISLTSMGNIVASLILNQAIVDHGARRAERDYAKYDVEVAAVALAEDSNDRVLQALELYLRAETARSDAAVLAAGMETMDHFSWIMSERVNAGVSDRVDLQVVTQRQNQMRSDLASARETVASATSELQAMSARPVGGITGLSPLGAPGARAQALAVMQSEAESRRAIAGAVAARAGFLPGLSVAGSVDQDGQTDWGLNIDAANALGFGNAASIRAIEAEEQAAAARVAQEREQANRTIAAMEGQLISLRRQEGEARAIAAQAAGNYELFAQQQRAGQRSVTETVTVFETKIRAERAAAELRYDIARLEIRIAAVLGALVDGEQI